MIDRRVVAAAPKPARHYVLAVVRGDLVCCAGQAAVDPASGELVSGVAEHTRQAVANIATSLSDAGSDLAIVLQARVLLRNLADFAVRDHRVAEAFGPVRPAQSTVPPTGFREGLEVAIDVIAPVRSEQGG